MRTSLLLLAASAILTAAAPADPFDRVWEKYSAAFGEAGIPKATARQAFLWTEFQHHLGQCLAHLDQGDVASWRLWWNGTALADTRIGRQILEAGESNYYAGVQGARRKPLSPQQCQRVVDSWLMDMKAATTLK